MRRVRDRLSAVAAVTATNLTGGVSPTLAPPYLRVFGTLLYIQRAGEWQEARIYALGTAP